MAPDSSGRRVALCFSVVVREKDSIFRFLRAVFRRAPELERQLGDEVFDMCGAACAAPDHFFLCNDDGRWVRWGWGKRCKGNQEAASRRRRTSNNEQQQAKRGINNNPPVNSRIVSRLDQPLDASTTNHARSSLKRVCERRGGVVGEREIESALRELTASHAVRAPAPNQSFVKEGTICMRHNRLVAIAYRRRAAAAASTQRKS